MPADHQRNDLLSTALFDPRPGRYQHTYSHLISTSLLGEGLSLLVGVTEKGRGVDRKVGE